MADPTKYQRGYSFSNFQANTPNQPLPGTRVDTELDEVAGNLGETIDALKDIRRSDGKLKAGSIDAASLTTDLVDEIVDQALSEAAASAAAAAVSEDAAAASALAADASADAAAASQATASAAAATSVANAALLGVWRGPWVTATAYAAGDRVSNAGNTYYATVAHTSAALFSTDLSALKWGIVAEKGATGAGTGDLLAAQNLNDVANKATARANLVVPETSTVLLKADNLSGLASAATARTNLGLGAMAVKANVAFADMVAAAVRLAAEGLASPTDVELATALWAKNYADSVGRVLLADKTVAGAPATSIDFTEFDNATYRYYEFVFEQVKPTTDGASFSWRSSTNGGSSYDSGASDYGSATEGYAAPGNAGASGNASVGSITRNALGNAGTEYGVTGEMAVFFAGDGSKRTRLMGLISYETTTPNLEICRFVSERNTAQDTNAIRFLMSVNNIEVGSRIRMYGFN